MENLLNVHNQLVGSDDRNSWNELQGNCCSVTQVSQMPAVRKGWANTGFVGYYPKSGKGHLARR